MFVCSSCVQAKFLPEQSPYEINLPEPGTPPPELDEDEELEVLGAAAQCDPWDGGADAFGFGACGL